MCPDWNSTRFYGVRREFEKRNFKSLGEYAPNLIIVLAKKIWEDKLHSLVWFLSAQSTKLAFRPDSLQNRLCFENSGPMTPFSKFISNFPCFVYFQVPNWQMKPEKRCPIRIPSICFLSYYKSAAEIHQCWNTSLWVPVCPRQWPNLVNKIWQVGWTVAGLPIQCKNSSQITWR